MTNVESYLQTAIEKMNAGELNSYEQSFISSIEDYSKKQLKGLSSKQYNLLRTIANK